MGVTAVREVLEETGVECEFERVLAFRQLHTARFSKSDMYFVCFLRAKHFNIVAQESEIAEARWMDVSWLLSGKLGLVADQRCL